MKTKCSKTDKGNSHNKHNIVECNFAKHRYALCTQSRLRVDKGKWNSNNTYLLEGIVKNHTKPQSH